MSEMLEVRWHARAGQGAVTAAKALAEAFIDKGNYVQAFPEYGPERQGAPLTAYNRISEEELSLHCQVANPNLVVVIDPTLITPEITAGTDENAVFIINSTESGETVKKKIRAPKNRVYTVDATRISLETLGRFLPNTPILGAIAKVTGRLSLDDLMVQVEKTFGKKFKEDIINKNKEAIRLAYEEVK